MFEIDDLGDDIESIVYSLAEQGWPLKAIARHPRVVERLSVIKPPEVCQEFAWHRYLQALVQRAKNPDGTRRFVSISRPRLFPLEESEEAGSTVFYASLEVVESTPAFKVLALRGMRRLIFGLVRRAGFISPETRDRLIKVNGDEFDRMIEELTG